MAMASISGSPAVGIDLGTTYSCVAVWIEGHVEVVSNSHGNRTMPSYVALNENEWLVGEEAKALAATDPKNTIFNIKRIIGKRFTDRTVQEDIKNWPFLVKEEAGATRIQVSSEDGSTFTFPPEELSAKVLRKMKESAETFLGKTVTDAVITVPAFFDNAQREATRAAGKLAGLNVLRVFNEPTAAAIAYGQYIKGTQKILVFDFGGGTLDVSILQVSNCRSFHVITTYGDMHLGGEDIDQLLVDHLVQDFMRQHKVNLKEFPVAIQRLRKSCEEAKRTLSGIKTTRISLECIYQQTNLETKLTRETLENLCSAIFARAILPVQQALNVSKLKVADIDQIVLTGGSSRIPKVQENLQKFFNGKQLQKSINPDEAIAIGAAIQANAIKTENCAIELIEVIPFSLGIAVTPIQFIEVLLPRNITFPTTCTKAFHTYHDNQDTVSIKIYEGERPLAKNNHLLNEFVLNELTKLPAGETTFDVTYTIDSDGILSVKAVDTRTKRENSVRIALNERSDPDQAANMLSDLLVSEKHDETTRENIQAMQLFSHYIQAAVSLGRKNHSAKTALEKAKSITTWWKENEQLLLDKDVYQKKLTEAKIYLSAYV